MQRFSRREKKRDFGNFYDYRLILDGWNFIRIEFLISEFILKAWKENMKNSLFIIVPFNK